MITMAKIMEYFKNSFLASLWTFHIATFTMAFNIYIFCGLLTFSETVSAFAIQPANFSIDGFVGSHEARLLWSVPSFDGIARFILVHKEDGSNSRTITEIEPEYTMHTLRDLKENTVYLVYLETVYQNGTTIRTNVIYFETVEIDYIIPPSRGGKPPGKWRVSKVVVLCAVGILWVGLIALFFKQWGIIRMFLPYAARVSYNQDNKTPKRKKKSRFSQMRARARQSKQAATAVPPCVILETDEQGGTRAVMDRKGVMDSSV